MSKSDSNPLGLTANLDTEVGKVVVDIGSRHAAPRSTSAASSRSNRPTRTSESLADLLVEN